MHISITLIMFIFFLVSTVLFSMASLMVVKMSTFLLSSINIFLWNMSYTKEIICFFSVVALITTIISLYSFFYLGLSYSTMNFMWTLSLFAFSMLCLILADSIAVYLLGWDGLGASSFLLILYYNTLFSYRSGLATFLTNRLGDVFIIMAFVLLASKENIMSQMQSYPMLNMYLQLAFGLMVLGAATKSAQLPFSAWLPAAMAAPTPVSALVHSSTLVTAGIYLLYRYETLIDCVYSNLSGIFSLMGILLSLLAGLMAFFESDFKKLVAMSTLSQLGILIYILLQKQSEFTLLHVMSHAFFKSLLFLVVGFLIVFGLGMQDARTKSFSMMLGVTSMVLLMLTSLSLMGFMFLPGFFSKDLILTSYPEQGTTFIPYVLLLLSCVMTVMYSTKSFIIVLNNMHLKQNMSNITFDKKFFFSSLLLCLFMMLFGYFFFFAMLESESYVLSSFNKALGLMIITSGLLLTKVIYKTLKDKNINPPLKYTVERFSQMVNMNWMSNNLMSSIIVKVSKALLMENSWMEMVSETKTSHVLISNKTNFSKETKKYSNIELILFFVITLLIILSFTCTL